MTETAVKPTIQAYLDILNHKILPKLLAEGFKPNIINAREALANVTKTLVTKPVDCAKIWDDTLDTQPYPVPVRIYHPHPEQVLPILIYFHGGGGSVGSVTGVVQQQRNSAILAEAIRQSGDGVPGVREARKRGPLRTLDSLQLRLHAQPLTIVPEQMTIWGHAWLQFGDTNVRCVVQVKRWTADAVGVQVTIDGDKLRCWVWQGACQRISDPTDVW